jgi:hypothetical protein
MKDFIVEMLGLVALVQVCLPGSIAVGAVLSLWIPYALSIIKKFYL